MRDLLLGTLLALHVLLAASAPHAADKPDTMESPDLPAPTVHHQPFELRHFHHHHRHYHHYRDKHWVAGLLLSVVGAVLGSCAAVGIWKRFCSQRNRFTEYSPPPPPTRGATATINVSNAAGGAFPNLGESLKPSNAGDTSDTAPLLQSPTPTQKGSPPPYKETWT